MLPVSGDEMVNEYSDSSLASYKPGRSFYPPKTCEVMVGNNSNFYAIDKSDESTLGDYLLNLLST